MSMPLPDSARVLIEADLAPAQGTRFQPTGFPDLGAATYDLPDGTKMLLVESAQSMANRLESVCWDEAADDLVPALAGTPYVRVKQGGKNLTTSVLEAHRLNSPYIAKAEGFAQIAEELGGEGIVDRRVLARGLLRRDPGSLIHGIFLEKITGTMRLPRALSAFIEARDVLVVTSGGVKNDRVSAEKDEDNQRTAKEGYGNVPFHRDEYAARSITAFFSIDLTQLRAFGLGTDAEQFLFALALWKIQVLLRQGLRLRTACDLDVQAVRVRRPESFVVPTIAELEISLKSLVGRLQGAGAFADPPVTELTFVDGKPAGGEDKPKKGGKAKGKAAGAAGA
jgi:CRISPR-associated protein Csb1